MNQAGFNEMCSCLQPPPVLWCVCVGVIFFWFRGHSLNKFDPEPANETTETVLGHVTQVIYYLFLYFYPPCFVFTFY